LDTLAIIRAKSNRATRYYGTSYVDPLTALHRRLRGAGRLPGYIGCKARLHPDLKGEQRCRTLWCPRCHLDVQRGRRVKLFEVFELIEDRGFSLWLVTLTVEHDHSTDLRKSMSILSKCWSSARQGSPYRRLRNKYGLLSALTAVDLTHGKAGWHPHIHAVVVARTSAGAAESGARLACRYEGALRRAEFKVAQQTTDDRYVWDAEGLAGYLTKNWRKSRNSLFVLLKRAARGCLLAAELFF
jgi:hypothetical protein